MPVFINFSEGTSLDVIGHRTVRRRGIVIHTTEGTNSLAWLQGESAKHGEPASADFLISRKGDIAQITPAGFYAYHSGRAQFGLYREMNGSINQGFYGIELEQYQALGQRVTDPQYIALAFLVRVLVTINNMSIDQLTTHHAVALPMGRKIDPTGFDWTIFTNELLHPSPDWNDVDIREELS